MEASIFYYVVFFRFLYFLTKRLLQDKGLPPSPALSLPIIGHLHLIKRPLHRTLAKLSQQHGPVLFFHFGSRPVVVVSSPSAAEECFTKNDVIFANRPRLLAGKHLGYDYTTLLWAPYGDHWRNLRRMASLEILSSNRVQKNLGIRMDEVRSLILRLYRSSNGGGFQVVEMKSILFELALNVMMRMTAGKRYFREGDEELEEEGKFKEIVTEAIQLSGATNIGDFLPVLQWIGLNKIEKKLSILQMKRDGFMQNLIEERRKSVTDSYSEKRSKTLVDVVLSLQETDPEYYTDNMIRGLLQVMLTAGTDTSAGTLEWALSLLLNNPKTLMKAREEIDIEADRGIRSWQTPIPPWHHKRDTKNVSCYPPTGTTRIMRRMYSGRFYVPRGTMLLVNVWAMQSDPVLWEKPTEFKPERFHGLEAEKNGFRFWPFGTGRRRCPGEGLAMRMVPFALGSLIQCFEWERIGEEMVDMTEGNGLTMPKAQPLVARCRPRPAMMNLLSQL
ncbi:Cytochrome P450 - like 10 [Theobroma cacao]|nr:Cytochrome P450 - like 10 [Theobroma cacao]